MARSARPTGDDPVQRAIWWGVAVAGVAGVVYAGVLADVVIGSMDWDLLVGRLDTHAPINSTPPPPGLPTSPVMPGTPAVPAAPAPPTPPPPAAPRPR